MSDPANTKLGRMLLDEITPVVMVISTPLVEESCRKNGLCLIEMLSPFSNFINIDVPVRTASDQPYRLRKFKLRLFYASEIRQPNIEAAKERLKQVISQAGDKDLSDLCSDPPDIESLTATSEQEFVPPWFQNFNKQLIDTVAFSEHEAFDHPVACILAVSSKDKDPIDKFVELFSTNQLPSLLNDGAMDPKLLKYFLLIHDSQDGTLGKATAVLTEMRNTFGATDCRLLCINSSTHGMEDHQENPWAYYKNISTNSKQLGCFINMDDMEELRNTVHDLSSKHIIPYMEQKIRVLNQQVSATRKGFRNQIKNLWWRKGTDEAPENRNGSMYTYSSTESQIRVLGDHAFMLRDYELALSNYRLISTDYKLDKAWKQYAGVQEMMGLAYFMLDHSRKDAEYCMENAFSTYSKLGSSGMRNATRCGIWWAEMLKARGQFQDAAGVYFRISGEEPLHSAVMLEQASYCFLLSTPTMLRKYGFHLVLSGDLYKKSDQIKHAIRTYRSALSIFKDTTWSHIRDHVHFHIGKWYAFLGIFDVAIKHILEVLICGHQSKATQEFFLQNFFRIVQETGQTFEILRFQLPAVEFSSIKVVFEDHRTYASPAAASVKESVWQTLEGDMIPSLSVMKTNWLESQPKVLTKKYKESNVSIAGEPIKVAINFRNPLQIPISISNVSLICKHSTQDDETEPDAAASLSDHRDDGNLKTTSVSEDFSLDTSLFTLTEVDVSLQGDETMLVQLTVTPKIEGTLKIVGVRWKLSSSVIGIYNFHSGTNRKKVAKGKKKQKRAKDDLQFVVIKTLPRLEGAINNLPGTVYAGELCRLTLELWNPSNISVKILKLRISHPRFLNIAAFDCMNLEFPSCLKKQANSLQQADTGDALDSVFVFPKMTSTWETPLTWPLWFRAAAAGSISLYLSLYYEIEDELSVMTYRTLRMHYNLKVLPSLEVSLQTSSCPSRMQEFLVRMNVVNRTNSESFLVHQLSCVGDQWELALLRPTDRVLLFEPLMAGQSLSCFFKLKYGRRQDNSSKEKTLFLVTSASTDVGLVDNDSKSLYNMAVSPFNLFHRYERLHQDGHQQDHTNSVDFILIFESPSESDAGQPMMPPRVFSHHFCHYRLASLSPVWWLMEGPRKVTHDFSSTSCCEVNLSMIVHNSLEDVLSIRINTLDFAGPVSGNESGWHDTSRAGEVKDATGVMGPRLGRVPPGESVPPFMWSGSSSTKFDVGPLSSVVVPMQISVFAPGTFDLSNYSLEWKVVVSGDGDASRAPSGTCRGHTYHIMVLGKE